MVNFFDAIQWIVMFLSDVIEVFLCEAMPSSTEESSAEDEENSANEGADKGEENALITELDKLE